MIYTYENDFAAFIEVRDAGEAAEIDEAMFEYFLDVLPPVYMRRAVKLPDGVVVHASFGMAEGCETITAFWTTRRDGEPTRYFAQRTDEINRG